MSAGYAASERYRATRTFFVSRQCPVSVSVSVPSPDTGH